MMAPREHEAITLDVMAYMWEKSREMVRASVLHSSCKRWIAHSILSGPAIILIRMGARPPECTHSRTTPRQSDEEQPPPDSGGRSST